LVNVDGRSELVDELVQMYSAKASAVKKLPEEADSRITTD
jgi:hypothetical protein